MSAKSQGLQCKATYRLAYSLSVDARRETDMRSNDARLLKAGAAIEDALERAIANPQWRTGDLGGPLGTKAFGERVAKLVEEISN